MINLRSDIVVDLISHNANDASVVKAAMVSTKGRGAKEENPSPEKTFGLLEYLMKNRHGSPFEHNSMTFFVQAPIFVFREFHRHRVGWSYNEESGRYTKLKPDFYVPGPERKLVQIGKPGHYEFVEGTYVQFKMTRSSLHRAYSEAYRAYEELLDQGVAREVARASLPVATYSSMYATCNARSLMHFLSLRTKRAGSTFPSYPQREIEMVAEQMEYFFKELMPVTQELFTMYGRVSP